MPTTCPELLSTFSSLKILRRKLMIRMNDLREMMVKPVPIWCISCSHIVKAKTKVKLSRIKITKK
jgi:hypothetical protein